MNTKRRIILFSLLLVLSGSASSMGLRSFVALPVETGGTVMRLSFEHQKNANIDTLAVSAAYGISKKQILLLVMPYRLSPAGNDRQGDVSILYRHQLRQDDTFSGTNRFSLLGGAIVPTENSRDSAVQAGIVFTHFINRHEIDADVLYQKGLEQRADTARYDLSWQYRLSPDNRPDWGLGNELNSVLELNGRWTESNNMTHQVTAGLQWINPKWVLEGGIAKDLNNEGEVRYLISTRFHF